MKQIKTKQTTLHRPRWALIAIVAMLTTAGILAACTPEEEHVTRKMPIMLSAVTKGVVDGGTDMTLYFAFAEQNGTGTYGSYFGSYTGTRSAGTGVQPFTPYSLALMYRISGLKTKITGWHPGGGSATDVTTSGNGYYDTTAKTVTWTINGTQDIIVSAAKEGSIASPIPPLVFEHHLTQILFHPYAETQTAIDAWGKITRIEVVNQQNTVQYSLIDNDATGAVTFTGTADKVITSTGIPAGGAALSLSSIADKGTKALRMGDPMMIASNASGKNITLNIFTDKKEIKTITLNRELKAGTPYRLYLQFTERDITIEASVAEWVNITTNDKLGHMRVGDYYYTDGTTSPKLVSGKTVSGIVYSIDPAAPSKFKIFSLDKGLKLWSAKSAYELSIAGQKSNDGKANVAAMKAYSTNNTNSAEPTKKTTGVFATDFPAAEFCDRKNTGDVTGWYLPAKDELVALYKAYTANETTLNAAISAAPGGVPLTNGYYWSSTENNYPTYNALRVSFSNGTAAADFKDGNNDLRCVRDIAPPPVVGNYYFTDGTYSSKLESGKTANGIIYYVNAANPSKFKVMALDQGRYMWWAGKTTYVIGRGAQSRSDGKGNSAAIKAYFDANTSTVGSDFKAAFPAAEYCYSYRGKNVSDPDPVGTWYLPAKDELQYLWCAYNGAAPVRWDSGVSNDVPPNTSKQGEWNRLVGAVGTAMGDNLLWSSNESSDKNGEACRVSFSVDSSYPISGTEYVGKNTQKNVRCVRDIN